MRASSAAQANCPAAVSEANKQLVHHSSSESKLAATMPGVFRVPRHRRLRSADPILCKGPLTGGICLPRNKDRFVSKTESDCRLYRSFSPEIFHHRLQPRLW